MAMLGKSYYFDAIREGHILKVALCLKEGTGIDINTTNDEGATGLIVATEFGKMEVVEFLLTYKPNLKIMDKREVTALGYAIFNEHVEIAEMILDAGFDINGRATNVGTALHAAVINNREHFVDMLLKRGADPTKKYKQSAIGAAFDGKFGLRDTSIRDKLTTNLVDKMVDEMESEIEI